MIIQHDDHRQRSVSIIINIVIIDHRSSIISHHSSNIEQIVIIAIINHRLSILTIEQRQPHLSPTILPSHGDPITNNFRRAQQHWRALKCSVLDYSMLAAVDCGVKAGLILITIHVGVPHRSPHSPNPTSSLCIILVVIISIIIIIIIIITSIIIDQ